MGRRKIAIEPLVDERNRSITFLKRKTGLFKKAHELAVLCQIDIAVIIFGRNKKVYKFSSSDTDELLDRYRLAEVHESKSPYDFDGRPTRPQLPLLGHHPSGSSNATPNVGIGEFESRGGVATGPAGGSVGRSGGAGSDDELEDDEEEDGMTSGSDMAGLRKSGMSFESPNTNNGSATASPALRNGQVGGGFKGNRAGSGSMGPGGQNQGGHRRNVSSTSSISGHHNPSQSAGSGPQGFNSVDTRGAAAAGTAGFGPGGAQQSGNNGNSIAMGPSGISRQKSGQATTPNGNVAQQFQYMQTGAPNMAFPGSYYRMAEMQQQQSQQHHHGMMPMDIDGRRTPNSAIRCGPGPGPGSVPGGGEGPSPSGNTVYRMPSYDHYSFAQASYGNKDGHFSALRQQGRPMEGFEWPAVAPSYQQQAQAQAQAQLQMIAQQSQAGMPLQRSQSAGGTHTRLQQQQHQQQQQQQQQQQHHPHHSSGMTMAGSASLSSPSSSSNQHFHQQRPKLKVKIPMGGGGSENEIKQEGDNDENRQPANRNKTEDANGSGGGTGTQGGGAGGPNATNEGGQGQGQGSGGPNISPADKGGNIGFSTGGPNSAWGTSILLPPLSPSAYLANQNSTGAGSGPHAGVGGVGTGAAGALGGGAAGGAARGGSMPSAHPASSSVNIFGRLPFGTQANGEQTPLSAALPSKYVNDLLPSPSNFYGTEWNTSFGPPSAYGTGPAGGGYPPVPSARPGMVSSNSGNLMTTNQNSSSGQGNNEQAGSNASNSEGHASGAGGVAGAVGGGGGGGGGPGQSSNASSSNMNDMFPSPLQFNGPSGHGLESSGTVNPPSSVRRSSDHANIGGGSDGKNKDRPNKKSKVN